MILVNYFIGIKIERESIKVRKQWMIISIVFNLGVLGFFKYFNFFIDSANVILKNLDVRIPFLEIILPVAISFIVFELMSYTIDIYRGTNKTPNSFLDLALLVAFFPHLIAGPILKPKHFLPQLQNEIIIRWKNVEQGTQIFIYGLVKKVLIADHLAIYVDTVFNSPTNYSSLTIWLAVIAYAIQIYCDFSGYTDMAIGSAKILGFEIPKNFDMPYISKNITEFWRRWHISLSSWLKEYLYISLGGNRKGKARQYINLMIVMLLGGLWHGASWNFVIWGGMHGIGLAIHKIYIDNFNNPKNKVNMVYKTISWFVTFIFVCIAWVFFRSADFTISQTIIQKMFLIGNTEGINWIATSFIITLPICIVSHLIGIKLKNYPLFRLNTFVGQFILMFVLLGLLFFAPTQSSPFIYFQF
jgi:alginate O-acetyltransferase complex protein AlgI